MKHKKLQDCNAHKRYERVVSRLPLFVEQNINIEAPLKSKGRLKIKISKIQASKLYHN
jgi:hypothetical protein